MLSRLQALAVSTIVLCSAAASAGEIYRCQVNGVTTFVDSPRGCLEGPARRVGGDASAATKPSPPVPRLEETRKGSDAASRGRPTPGQLPARSQSQSGLAALPCQKLAQEPARARECLREERRTEVRRVASARMVELSRAVADYVSRVSGAGSLITVSNDGRPPAWCESILGDLMAQRDIEVVDDESAGGPEWARAGTGPARSAVEILDPNFQEWSFAGSKVPNGYVTARWRGSNLVVLRVVAACTAASDGTARCNPHRLVSIYVYDAATPMACDVAEVERAYWPNWKNSKTPIFTRLTRQ
jgi:hypothetical protein